jgi:hypothetical protein
MSDISENLPLSNFSKISELNYINEQKDILLRYNAPKLVNINMNSLVENASGAPVLERQGGCLSS